MEYIVSAFTIFGESVGYSDKPENNPERAIIKWCMYSEKYPTCVSIQPKTNEDGMILLIWANQNFEKIEHYMDLYKCPYKTEWLREQIDEQIKKGKTSMMWEYDQLFPFCMR